MTEPTLEQEKQRLREAWEEAGRQADVIMAKRQAEREIAQLQLREAWRDLLYQLSKQFGAIWLCKKTVSRTERVGKRTRGERT